MTTSLSRRRFLAKATAVAAGLGVPHAVFNLSPRKVFAAEGEYDLIISGGTVVDGSGKKRYSADVAIQKRKIVKIGRLGDASAARKLNATGLMVTPGFIDMHTHSDRTLLADGTAQSAIRQGATTHVIGNCGSSPAPLREPRTANGQKFQTYGEFLRALTGNGISINVCGLVGHNTIRAAVMGFDARQPTAAELKKMQAHVAEAMRGGAVGMSTGLVSPPGVYSKTSEIVALARVVAKMGGLYASHIRGEAGALLDSVTEAIQIAREARVPVEISHHKAAGKENWGKTRHTLAMIEEANRQGLTVRCDVYPYRAGSAGMSQLIPPWAHEGGRTKMLARLKDPKTRKRITHDMTVGVEGWPNFFKVDWDDIQITRVKTAANQKWVGKKVADVARARGTGGIETCINLLIEEDAGIGMINFIIDEPEMQRVLSHPLSMVGSDGTAVNKETAAGKPHPRYYGCFPRVLGRYCREKKLFSLETAIHKMTGMTATQLGLPDRGFLREGYAADVVLLDFDTVIDKATFTDPHQYPEGIDTVIVNGRLVVHRGKHNNEKPGRILRPQRS